MKQPLTEIGWREEVLLPELATRKIKAKIDTGARTSALHVTNLEYFQTSKKNYVRYKVHPVQDSSRPSFACESEVIEMRKVKSSTGHETLRPVIEVEIVVGDLHFTTELTLVNRDLMGFRMLLGRQALRDRFLVNVAKSFLTKKKKKKRKSVKTKP